MTIKRSNIIYCFHSTARLTSKLLWSSLMGKSPMALEFSHSKSFECNQNFSHQSHQNYILRRFNGADLRNVCTEAGLFAIRWLLGLKFENLRLANNSFVKLRKPETNKIQTILFYRSEREYVVDEDFMKAVRKVQRLTTSIPHNIDFLVKVAENKKLETKLDYKPVWNIRMNNAEKM